MDSHMKIFVLIHFLFSWYSLAFHMVCGFFFVVVLLITFTLILYIISEGSFFLFNSCIQIQFIYTSAI